MLRKLFLFIFLSCILYLGSETFRFNYAKGDSYRILSTVKEDVLVNGKLDHRAEIVNRISVDITETDKLSGKHDAVFMTSQTAVQGVNEKEFVWGTEYKSIFWCSELGEYSMSDEYFMPNARNVPLFPEYDVGIGESWIAQGYEVHDLRKYSVLPSPTLYLSALLIPMQALKFWMVKHYILLRCSTALIMRIRCLKKKNI